jgi:hypothetical protein
MMNLKTWLHRPYAPRLTLIGLLSTFIGAGSLEIITLSNNAFITAVFLIALLLTDVFHDYSPDTPDPLTPEQREAAAATPDRDVDMNSVLRGVLDEETHELEHGFEIE